jgi:hypothetical protein
MLENIRKSSRQKNLPRRYKVSRVEPPVEGHLSTTNIRAKWLGIDMIGGQKGNSVIVSTYNANPSLKAILI